DEIRPSNDGRELRAVWRRWAHIGGSPGELVDPGLTSDVRWTLHDGMLARSETLTARAPITIRAWRLIVPTTAATCETIGGETVLSGSEGRIAVTVTTPWPVETHVHATGNDSGGRGARGYIPLHVTYDARDLYVAPDAPLTWQLTLR